MGTCFKFYEVPFASGVYQSAVHYAVVPGNLVETASSEVKSVIRQKQTEPLAPSSSDVTGPFGTRSVTPQTVGATMPSLPYAGPLHPLLSSSHVDAEPDHLLGDAIFGGGLGM